MSKWIYLSYPLSFKTPAFGNEDSLKIQHKKSMEKSDSCNTQYWSLSNHLGTHIDCPRHFVSHGKTLSDYSPDFWIFYYPFIIDISPVEPDLIIQTKDIPLNDTPENMDMLIIKTGFSLLRGKDIYYKNNPGFAPELAVFLRKHFQNLRIFGFDSISLSSFAHRETGREAHKAFLDHPRPILLLEDMNLSMVNNSFKFKQIIVSPLIVDSADGAPCTIFADVVE
jgi:arylformamidase